MRINNYIKKIKKNIYKHVGLSKKNICFSIGENCLPDNILNRYNLKSFSSPYSSGRSNIEYILYYEHEEFNSFTDCDLLKKEFFNNTTEVIRNQRIQLNNTYHESCMNGFEFTHHNVLDNEKARAAINRRCSRLLGLHNKNIVMLYHHRMCETTDEMLLIKHLKELSDIYKQRNNNVNIFCFTQAIVNDSSQRKVEKSIKDEIHLYRFYTLNEWAGDNQNIFWGLCDDDLIKKMMDDIATVLNK